MQFIVCIGLCFYAQCCKILDKYEQYELFDILQIVGPKIKAAPKTYLGTLQDFLSQSHQAKYILMVDIAAFEL